MYLGIADEEIKKERDKTENKNKKLIKDFNNLPFWKKLGDRENNVFCKVQTNWKIFIDWEKKKIREKSFNDKTNNVAHIINPKMHDITNNKPKTVYLS